MQVMISTVISSSNVFWNAGSGIVQGWSALILLQFCTYTDVAARSHSQGVENQRFVTAVGVR